MEKCFIFLLFNFLLILFVQQFCDLLFQTRYENILIDLLLVKCTNDGCNPFTIFYAKFIFFPPHPMNNNKITRCDPTLLKE